MGEGTVAEVQASLKEKGRKLAPTTVATVLRRLEHKGWIAHREDGRAFLYRAMVSQREASGRLVNRLAGGVFGGDVPALVSQLLDSRGVGKHELEQIKRLIEAKERRTK